MKNEAVVFGAKSDPTMDVSNTTTSSTYADPLPTLMQIGNVMFLGAALFGDILIIRVCLGVAFILYVRLLILGMLFFLLCRYPVVVSISAADAALAFFARV